MRTLEASVRLLRRRLRTAGMGRKEVMLEMISVGSDSIACNAWSGDRRRTGSLEGNWELRISGRTCSRPRI